MFKIGDKVRRKAEFRDPSEWDHGDRTLTVKEVHLASNSVYFEEIESVYGIFNFEPAKPERNRVVEAMESAKVGPFKVRVWVSVDPATPLTEVRAGAVQTLLAEVDDNYRDPEIGHDDTIVRLQDLLEKREDVAAYEITGTDGCGVVVYPDWR
jgi:hypothetical protein